MIRVEVQNADVSIQDEKIAGSLHGNSGTNLIMLSDNYTGFMPYRIDNFSIEMTTSCLVKDPSKRPSVKKFLTHSFFKQARSNDYILRTLLKGLPALGDHLKALKGKEEDMLAQKKIPDGQMEEMSQLTGETVG
ncbi:Serine/threonine-protein kinase fray2 [Camellia lanceoleosa]|uniref:Serine/threonine-protein kinase fray2 n=1 Tax=Camellia lanceoleosa TaxID=1840588 RepID=A0ACC0HS78_9ERIC|nr:Serine/threonine-protein kinase fray2 [Camellia lanceoleosa]